jgi:hypothetical protein
MAGFAGLPRRWPALSSAIFRALPLTLLIATGCSTTVDIDARDEVNFANLEASIPLKDDGTLRLRLRGASASGDFDQSLEGDERVVVDGKRIRGPAELDGNVDIDYYSLALGWDRKYADAGGGHWRPAYYVGIQQTEFDLALESANKRIDDSDSTTTIYFQFLLDYAVTDALDIGFNVAAGADGDESFSTELDLRLEYAFYRQLRVVGGYRWYEYYFESEPAESDLEVDFRGPFLGLNLAF